MVQAALREQGILSPHVEVAALATIKVETGARFAPIREFRADPTRMPKLWATQERYWPSGYYGRGYIQLTWERNYKAAGEALGIDLLGQPDLALDPTQAARIFAWYFRTMHIEKAANAQDWEKVRHLVNGGDTGMTHFKCAVVSLLTAMSGGSDVG